MTRQPREVAGRGFGDAGNVQVLGVVRQLHHAGNRMALANIRERLTLHFDVEASIKTKATDDTYEVHIVIPYQKGAV